MKPKRQSPKPRRPGQAAMEQALSEMVDQHCWDEKLGHYCSDALSANATALRVLAGRGRMRILRQYGRMVVAKRILTKKERAELRRQMRRMGG